MYPVYESNNRVQLPHNLLQPEKSCSITRDQFPAVAPGAILSEEQRAAMVSNVMDRVYGRVQDPIHREMTQVLNNVSKLEIMVKRPNSPINVTSLLLGNGRLYSYSLLSLLHLMHNFQDHMPALFEKMGYDKDLEFLEDVLKKYGETYTPPDKPNEAFTVVRPIADFTGKRLVFGCGDASTSCAGHPKDEDYTVNLDTKAKPDLLVDYNSQAFWKELPSDRFSEIFFESCPLDFHTSALTQMSRVLRVGGIVRFEFETPLTWAHQADADALGNYFRSCGFSDYEIRQETYRSHSSTSERQILVLHKRS